jgi:hypothetical protein
MKNKKTLVVVIVIIVAVILLVVAGWLIYKKFIKKDEEKKDVPLSTDDSAETPVVTDTNIPVVANGPSDVKKFQDWMDINHPNWVKGKNLNKGSGYGTYGPSTQSAWGLWKDAFLKPTDSLETARLNCKSPNIWMGNYCQKPNSTTSTTSTAIKIGDRVYTRSAGRISLYKFPAYGEESEIGYLNTGTYNQGCNTANSVYVCMDKTIGSVLGVFPNDWTKVRVDAKHFNKSWSGGSYTSTPQDFFIKSFQIVKR